MGFCLVGRLHVNASRNQRNTWKNLGGYIHKKMYILEPTKANILVKGESEFDNIQDKLKRFNQKNHTDVFVERGSCDLK